MGGIAVAGCTARQCRNVHDTALSSPTTAGHGAVQRLSSTGMVDHHHARYASTARACTCTRVRMTSCMYARKVDGRFAMARFATTMTIAMRCGEGGLGSGSGSGSSSGREANRQRRDSPRDANLHHPPCSWSLMIIHYDLHADLRRRSCRRASLPFGHHPHSVVLRHDPEVRRR